MELSLVLVLDRKNSFLQTWRHFIVCCYQETPTATFNDQVSREGHLPLVSHCGAGLGWNKEWVSRQTQGTQHWSQITASTQLTEAPVTRLPPALTHHRHTAHLKGTAVAPILTRPPTARTQTHASHTSQPRLDDLTRGAPSLPCPDQMADLSAPLAGQLLAALATSISGGVECPSQPVQWPMRWSPAISHHQSWPQPSAWRPGSPSPSGPGRELHIRPLAGPQFSAITQYSVPQLVTRGQPKWWTRGR